MFDFSVTISLSHLALLAYYLFKFTNARAANISVATRLYNLFRVAQQLEDLSGDVIAYVSRKETGETSFDVDQLLSDSGMLQITDGYHVTNAAVHVTIVPNVSV